MKITCNNNSVLTTIPRGCTHNFGNITMIAVGRKGEISFSTAETEDITVLADWETKTAATDDTKLVIIHNIAGLKTDDPSFIESSAEESVAGVPEIIGETNATFSGVITGVKGSIAKAAKLLMSEELEVILFNEYNQIISLDGSTALDGSVLTGFPIAKDTFGFSTPSVGGKNAKDKSIIKFTMEDPDWRNDSVVSDAAFKLRDLYPAYEA